MQKLDVMKALLGRVPVALPAGDQTFRVEDYSINADTDGNIYYTAGCIDRNNKYQSFSFEQLTCDETQLQGIKYKNPVWSHLELSVDDVISAMKCKSPVITANGLCFSRISQLSISRKRGEGKLGYSVTVEDPRKNTVKCRPETVHLREK